MKHKNNKLLGTALKRYWYELEQKMPFIPDFSDVLNLGKIALVSCWITIIYSFTQITTPQQFFPQLFIVVKNFIPYLALQLTLLLLFSPIINKLKSICAIFLIVLLNFFCLYIIHSLVHQSLTSFINDFSTNMLQFYVSLGIVFIFLIYFDWKEKNLDPANNLAKLMFLQAKMRPHFLFNTLNSVIALIKKDADKSKKMLLNLSELLRVSITEKDITQMYSLREELSLCNKYLEIEQLRLGERLVVNIQTDPECLNAKVPKLFLQPLVENAVLHGIAPIQEKGVIEILIHRNLLSYIQIEVRNPIALGSIEEKVKTSGGNKTALSNLHERLKMYYYNDVQFITEQRDQHYYVFIQIPFVA